MWDELPEDVLLEISDIRFASRTHGKRGTYARPPAGAAAGEKGCRGPLCRKAERDEAELKYARRRARLGKVARIGLKDDDVRARDELLDRIQQWHECERYLAKLNRLVQSDTDIEDDDDLQPAV